MTDKGLDWVQIIERWTFHALPLHLMVRSEYFLSCHNLGQQIVSTRLEDKDFYLPFDRVHEGNDFWSRLGGHVDR